MSILVSLALQLKVVSKLKQNFNNVSKGDEVTKTKFYESVLFKIIRRIPEKRSNICDNLIGLVVVIFLVNILNILNKFYLLPFTTAPASSNIVLTFQPIFHFFTHSIFLSCLCYILKSVFSVFILIIFFFIECSVIFVQHFATATFVIRRTY